MAPVPAHLCAVFLCNVLSRLCVLQGLREFFLPDPRLPATRQSFSERIWHSVFWQGFLPYLHACLAGDGAGEITSAGRRSVPPGPFVRRFSRNACIPDDAHRRQHLLSLGP